jgi:hypothetical protein
MTNELYLKSVMSIYCVRVVFDIFKELFSELILKAE